MKSPEDPARGHASPPRPFGEVDLVRARIALSRSISRLGKEDSLQQVLSTVLHEAVRTVGAVSGSIFLCDPGAELPVQAAAVLRGEIIDVETDPRVAICRDRSPLELDTVWLAAMRSNEISWIDYAKERPESGGRSIPFHRLHRHRLVAIVPMQGAEAPGYIGIAWDESVATRPAGTQLELLRVLAEQVGLAMKITRLAEAAALAQRAEESGRAARALQRMIDAIANLESLDALLPFALRIFAEAFEADSAAFYEHDEAGPRLRYWHQQGRTYGPAELNGSTDERLAFVDRAHRDLVALADPLAGDRKRRTARIVDRGAATDGSARPASAPSTSRRYELSMPLVVKGVANASLVTYHAEDKPFSAGDIALAEALGKQVALALQTSLIAEKDLTLAIARERASTAQRRAADLALANQALKSSSERLVALDDLDGYLERLIQSAAHIADAVAGCIVVADDEQAALRTLSLVDDSASDGALRRVDFPRTMIPLEGDAALAWQRTIATQGYWWTDTHEGGFDEVFRAYHLRRGHAGIAHVLMSWRRQDLGIFSLAFRSLDRPPDSRMEMFCVLAQQAALAIGITRLADVEKAVAANDAVSDERSRMAGEIHDNLAQSFTSIAMQSEALLAQTKRWRHAEGPRSVDRQSIIDRVTRVAGLIEETARHGQSAARESIAVLRLVDGAPSASLEVALRSLATRSDIDGEVRCRFRMVGSPRGLTQERQIAALRIAQEAVNNAMRHARATTVLIELRYQPNALRMTVEDDGLGLRSGSTGFGIPGMVARADAVGGSVDIVEVDPHGTRVTFEVPRGS